MNINSTALEYGKRSAKKILCGIGLETAQASVLAQILGVHVSHIYHAKTGCYTPTLLTALVNAGYMLPKPPRFRFSCDVPKGVNARKFRAAMRRYKWLAIGESI